MRRKARKRLTTMIKVVWTIKSGKAKFRGLSPCNKPLDAVLIEVMFTGAIVVK